MYETCSSEHLSMKLSCTPPLFKLLRCLNKCICLEIELISHAGGVTTF